MSSGLATPEQRFGVVAALNAFSDSQKKLVDVRSLFLTVVMGLISSPPSRSGEGRVAIVFDTWQRDVGGRYDAGPWTQ